MNIKKILIVIGFILIVFLLGFALYWVFFRGAPKPEDDLNYNVGEIPGIGPGEVTIIDENINEVVTLPWQEYIQEQVSPVANGGLTAVTKVTDTETIGFSDSSLGLQYYDSEKQQFFTINENGETELLSDKKFYGVDNVTWTDKGDKAILEYPDGSNILYNFNTGQQVTLPHELEDFAFNPIGNKITSKWIGNSRENNWLIASNDDGSGMRLLEPLWDQEHNTDMVVSPDNQIAAMHRKYIDTQRQEVFPIGFHDENFKSFTVHGAGFTSKWSPQGETLLYSVYHQDSDYLPTLWLTKGRTSQLGDLKASLNVNTWPDKCSFSNEATIYCAIPQGLPRGAGLYPEIADDYPDNFYRINLSNGMKTLIASPVGESGGYSATNIFFSNDGNIMYFVDKGTGQLQSIRLN